METNEITTNAEVEVEASNELESGRDYLKDGLAIGAGLLAIDGAVHVAKYMHKKAIKPLTEKIKTKIQVKKEAKAKKLAEVESKVEDVTE